mmetsp:Transcript_9831/g.37042  ORF Transcript_9831/g.37042 Transcript_9831/m.37042 type:complete len:249 (+) Transcript_9831:3797-4543(+)
MHREGLREHALCVAELEVDELHESGQAPVVQRLKGLAVHKGRQDGAHAEHEGLEDVRNDWCHELRGHRRPIQAQLREPLPGVVHEVSGKVEAFHATVQGVERKDAKDLLLHHLGGELRNQAALGAVLGEAEDRTLRLAGVPFRFSGRVEDAEADEVDPGVALLVLEPRVRLVERLELLHDDALQVRLARAGEMARDILAGICAHGEDVAQRLLERLAGVSWYVLDTVQDDVRVRRADVVREHLADREG